MENMERFFNLLATVFPFLFIGVFIFIVGLTIFCFVTALSPKARARAMGRQVKAAKYMVDECKDDLEDLNDFSGDLAAKNIKKGTKAFVEGLNEGQEAVYCKYCGEKIDADSQFCKYCGKRQ